MGVVDSLCSLPAGDCNYTSALTQATKAQLQLAIQIMKMNEDGNHKSRIAACEKQIQSFDEKKRTEKAEKKVTPKANQTTKVTTKETKPKKNEPEKVVAFPGKKPQIKKLEKSNESHTYEECEKKILEETKAYSQEDDDNRFVINGLLAKCKEDADFRNNLCRKDKTYEGFLQYMFDAASKGYCIKIGSNKGMLTKEKALDLAYDYYNMSELIKPEEKKKVAEKLTKEVNKIAKEVNEETKEEPKEEPTILNMEPETAEGYKEEDNGQLQFSF